MITAVPDEKPKRGRPKKANLPVCVTIWIAGKEVDIRGYELYDCGTYLRIVTGYDTEERVSIIASPRIVIEGKIQRPTERSVSPEVLPAPPVPTGPQQFSVREEALRLQRLHIPTAVNIPPSMSTGPAAQIVTPEGTVENVAAMMVSP